MFHNEIYQILFPESSWHPDFFFLIFVNNSVIRRANNYMSFYNIKILKHK